MRLTRHRVVPVVSLIAALSGPLVLGGCDPKASQEAEAYAAFRGALAKAERADLGLPEEGAEGDTRRWRQGLLNEAVRELDTVITTGPAGLRAEAQKQKAMLEAALVDAALADASVGMAHISEQGSLLLAELRRLNSIQARGEGSEIDAETAIGILQEQIALHEQEGARLDAQVAEVRPVVEALQAEYADAQAAAEAAFLEQTRLENQALRQRGDQRFATENASVARKRVADAAALERDQLGEQLDSAETRLRELTDAAGLHASAADELRGRVQGLRELDDASGQAVQDALAEMDSVRGAMAAQLDALVARYMQEVHQAVSAAIVRANDAVRLLDPAEGGARDAEGDLLQQRALLARALTRRALYAERFKGLAQTIAQQIEAPEAQASLNQLDVEALRADAGTAVAQGLAMAGELDGGPQSEFADLIGQSLERMRGELATQ